MLFLDLGASPLGAWNLTLFRLKFLMAGVPEGEDIFPFVINVDALTHFNRLTKRVWLVHAWSTARFINNK